MTVKIGIARSALDKKKTAWISEENKVVHKFLEKKKLLWKVILTANGMAGGQKGKESGCTTTRKFKASKGLNGMMKWAKSELELYTEGAVTITHIHAEKTPMYSCTHSRYTISGTK